MVIEKLESLLNELGIPIINCFGTKKYRLSIGGVQVWNEKLGQWTSYPYVQHFSKCPVCGKLIFVRAIKGTTYIGLCSEECSKKLEKKEKEVGDLWKALKFFRVNLFEYSDEDVEKIKKVMSVIR